MEKRIETSYRIAITEIMEKFKLQGQIKNVRIENMYLVVTLQETKKKNNSIFSMD
jgi:hypothetical protein